MTIDDLRLHRLYNHRLVGDRFTSVEETVKWFGAVQSQDYGMAKWSIGQRVEGATDETIEKAYNDGTILRTHVMRPTWHFILPENLVWMQKYTSDRVRVQLAQYDKRLEITPELRKKADDIIEKALRDKNYKTRLELFQELEKHDIYAKGQQLAHLLMYAELDALICSGPRRGKQFTYALVAERAPKQLKKTRDDALASLALSYFRSHGPAQMRDFVWWSGLTLKDGKDAVNSIKSKLEEVITDEKIYWFVPNTNVKPLTKPVAHLLSVFDEYVIAYNDRDAIGTTITRDLWIRGAALNAVILLNGKMIGTWKRTIKKNGVDVKSNLFGAHSTEEMQSIQEAVKRYKAFI